MRSLQVYVFKFNIKGLVVLEATQTCLMPPQRMAACVTWGVGTDGRHHQLPCVFLINLYQHVRTYHTAQGTQLSVKTWTGKESKHVDM